VIYLGYLLLGICAGVLAGAFGVGGGIIIIPVLILVFNQPVQTAFGTSLMVIIATSIAGTIRHWSMDNVNLTIAIFVSIGGIVGAYFGAPIFENVPDYQAKRALAILLAAVALHFWFSK
jgi:uncharacterized protein